MSEGSKGSSLAFGQVVIGPPGSGKTTYCHGMQEFLGRIGRKVAVVNLDPANEGMPYSCAVDISELITLPDVMESLKLGPNGGLIYCMEYLEANLDWLQEKLAAFKGHYYLFDCPGQVELYTHHNALKNVFAQMAKWNFRVGSGLCRERPALPLCKGFRCCVPCSRGFWLWMWVLMTVCFTNLFALSCESALSGEEECVPILCSEGLARAACSGRLMQCHYHEQKQIPSSQSYSS